MNRETTSADEYPIVLVSYHIGCVQYDDQAKADAVKAFETYVISEEGQKAAADAAGSSPITVGRAGRGADGRRRHHGGRLIRPARRRGPGRPVGRPGPSCRVGTGHAPATVHNPRTDQTERSVTTTSAPPETPGPRTRPKRRLGDRIFAGSATGAGVLILLVLAGVATFLIIEAWPAVTAPPADIAGGDGLAAYIAPLLFGTLLAAVIALLVATPLAVAIALYITYYAPRRLAAGMGYVIDLLAAIPSVVYGFWGIAALAPALVPFYVWAEEHLGFIPFFAGPASATGRTMLTAGHHARRHDPADHLGDLARGVQPGPRPAPRGGAGPGRHPLGDDQDGGAPLRQVRGHRRRHAGPGPGARRDARHRHRAVGLRAGSRST